MAIGKPQAAAPQENPYVPPGPEPLIFEEFEGINTSTTRVGVDDKQMAWCSGFMPIGPRYLRVIPGLGTALFTAPTSTIVFFGFANIGSTPYCIAFLADGSIWAINTITGAFTNIAGANTISSPSVLTTGMSQWGSQYVLIVNKQTNGYFIWDGTLFYQASTLAPGVTLTNTGTGYTSAPGVAASGGSGTGATFVASINPTGAVTSVTVNNGGEYLFNTGQTPIGSVSFSGGSGTGAAATVSWQFLTSAPQGDVWGVGSINMTNFGTGYVSAPTVIFSTPGGLIITASFTAVVTTTSLVNKVTMTNPGIGYLSTDSVSLVFSGGGGSGAAATVTLMPFGIAGTAVETAFQRVWIINGAVLQASVAGLVSNFSTSSGGVNVTSNDSFLRVGYTRLLQTNGFLYLIGDSSMNYISGVQTSGSPPTTTYTNQNADPEIGTPYPATAVVFGRNIVMANTIGAFVSYGAAVTKISAELDGVYDSVANFGGQQLSAAKAEVFGKKIWVLLVPIIDPVTGGTTNELFLWLEEAGRKKWFSTQQDVPLNFVASQEINSVLTAWGTDGAKIYPLFQTASISFTKRVQSKLWAKPGGYQFGKATTRFWGIAQYYDSRSQNFDVAIDNEVSSQHYTISPPNVAMTWTEPTATMTWTTNGVTSMTWSLGATGIRTFDPLAVGQQGVVTGMTIATSAADVALISAMMADEIVQYRG